MDFKRDMAGDIVKLRSDLVQLKFNSLELDSEVGRLVLFYLVSLVPVQSPNVKFPVLCKNMHG